MAEIHVQPKKNTTPIWLWILVGVVILAAVAFVLIRNKNNQKNNTATPPNETSYVQWPQPTDVVLYS
jgi:hypothetical protein